MTRYFHPATANELQCDLDSARAVRVFRAGLKMLRESKHVKVLRWSLKPSATRGHWHGRVWTNRPFFMHEQILLQLALGDDPIRGLMNWGRVKNGDPYPVLLIDHRPPGVRCECENTKRLPRCPCARKLQSSEAEFLPRNASKVRNFTTKPRKV
jgi:hypothetical protein